MDKKNLLSKQETNTASGRIRPVLEDFQNPYKLFSHRDRVNELADTGDTRPIHMTVGLTNFCNHKCKWCYIGWAQSGKGFVDSGSQEERRSQVTADERLIEAIGEAQEIGLKAISIVGDGEPTLHPKFVTYLDRLGSMGLDIGIFTNLSFKDPEILESLIRNCFFVRGSIDAASPESHQVAHGANDFKQVVSNLERFVESRKGEDYPILGVQFVVNQDNYREICLAAKFYREIGVDYLTLKPAYKNVLNPAHPENEAPLEEVITLMQEAQSFSTDSYHVYAKIPQFLETMSHKVNGARYYKKCLATPLSPYLDEDGTVEMCGNLKGRGFSLGNIYDSSFKEIWESELRRECLAKIDLHTCPAGCKLDPLNKVLWDALRPEKKRFHPNFI